MKTSIIVPTYKHNPTGCLESVAKNTDLSDMEVVVVANGAPESTLNLVRGMGNPFRLIVSAEPLGYTKAINVGVMAAHGEKVILMNDDLVILDWWRKHDWVRALELPFSDPSVVVTGAMKDRWSKNLFFLVFFLVMLRKDKMIELGMLDEAFSPGCGEDTDFCIKAQNKGYKIVQVPKEMDYWKTEMPIWHEGHATISKCPEFEGVGVRNQALLDRRYPRTEEDVAMATAFSMRGA